MNQPKILLGVSFVMVFCAGIAIGFLVGNADNRNDKPPWLAGELGLTSQQQREMKDIWRSVREKACEFPSHERRQLGEKRDAAVKELLSGDSVKRYEEILETYSREKEELIRAWKAPFEEAMEKTRKILSEEQFQKFEELGKKEDRDWNHARDRGGSRENEAVRH
jgi:hypothetical protein